VRAMRPGVASAARNGVAPARERWTDSRKAVTPCGSSFLAILFCLSTVVLAEGPSPRYALDPGTHRLRTTTLQRVRVEPPGRGVCLVVVETEETWKADVVAEGSDRRLALTWEKLRVKDEATGEWKEVDATKPASDKAPAGADKGPAGADKGPAGADKGPAGADWAAARLAALRGKSFEVVLSADGGVRDVKGADLDLAAPPNLPQEVHEAMWRRDRLAASFAEMWVRLPARIPSAEETVETDETDCGVRRLRRWTRLPVARPGDENASENIAADIRRVPWWDPKKEAVLYREAVFPAGAPRASRDAMTTISPEVVSAGWDDATEAGTIDIDLATGAVRGAAAAFNARLRLQVRVGEGVETWDGEATVERVLQIDPAQ